MFAATAAHYSIGIDVLKAALLHPETREQLHKAEYKDPSSGKHIEVTSRSSGGRTYITCGFKDNPGEEAHRHLFDDTGQYIGHNKNGFLDEEARQQVSVIRDSKNFVDGIAAS